MTSSNQKIFYPIINTKMKKLIYIIFVLSLVPSIYAQQTFELPHNYNDQFLRNPAATGLWNAMEVSAFYSKSFTNIERAPTVFFGALQYPLPGQNAAFGVAFTNESASLLSHSGLSGTFAYKLRGLAKKDDYLSLGIGTHLDFVRFNGLEAIVSNENDPNLGGSESGFGINFQAGFLYSSSDNIGQRNSDDLIFQVGAGASRLKRSVNIRSIYTFKDEMQLNAFGALILAQSNAMVIQSYLEALYETNGEFNLTLGGRATFAESFIAGISVDNQVAIGVELGFKMKAFGDGRSSVIVNFSVPFSEINNYANPGVGISYRHTFDLSGSW